MNQKIKDTIEAQEKKLHVFRAMLPVFENYKGKNIDARIKTKLAEVLPMYTISYHKSDYWREVKVWGNGIDFNSMVSVHVPNPDQSGATRFPTEAKAHAEVIERLNAWIVNTEQYIAQLKREAVNIDKILADFRKVEVEFIKTLDLHGGEISYLVREMIENECPNLKF